MYLIAVATKRGVSPTFAPYLAVISGGGGIVGRALAGIISDMIGPINVMIGYGLVAAITTFAWPYCTTKGTYIVIAVFFG